MALCVIAGTSLAIVNMDGLTNCRLLNHRLRHWSIIKTPLGQCILSVGTMHVAYIHTQHSGGSNQTRCRPYAYTLSGL